MRSPLQGSGPALHKCYAPHCTLWTNHPALAPSQYRVTPPSHPASLAAHRHVMRWIEVLIIRFLLRDYTLNDPVRKIHSMAPCIKYDRAV